MKLYKIYNLVHIKMFSDCCPLYCGWVHILFAMLRHRRAVENLRKNSREKQNVYTCQVYIMFSTY